MSIINRILRLQTKLDRPSTSILSLVAIILIIITFFLVWLQTRGTTAQVALHYNVITGVDVLGPAYYLYFIPVSSAVIFTINLVVMRLLKVYTEFLVPLLLGASVLVSALGLLASLLLLWLN